MNVFEKAKTKAKASPAKANDKVHVAIKNLSRYVGFDAMIKTIKSMMEISHAECNDQSREFFITQGTIYGKRPDNFRGTDGNVSASMELRKRSPASGLKDEELALLDRFAIPYKEVVEFKFNTELMTPEVMEEVSKALEKVIAKHPDLITVGKNLKIVTEESITACFKSTGDEAKDEARIRAVLPVVGTQAIKGSYPDFDLVDMMEEIATEVTGTKMSFIPTAEVAKPVKTAPKTKVKA